MDGRLENSSWRSWIELALSSVAGGLSSATLVLFAKGIADVGDLLGFAGAFVGAVMTIGGAIWVDRRRAHDASLSNRRYLVECLRRVEELASLSTGWIQEIDDRDQQYLESTLLSLQIQIAGNFAEMQTILSALQQGRFSANVMSARLTVNMDWLANRAAEGVTLASKEHFRWPAIFDSKQVGEEYVEAIRYCCTTCLVLAWRNLLILGEEPMHLDHSSIKLEPEIIVHRHKTGLDF